MGGTTRRCRVTRHQEYRGVPQGLWHASCLSCMRTGHVVSLSHLEGAAMGAVTHARVGTTSDRSQR